MFLVRVEFGDRKKKMEEINFFIYNFFEMF